MGVAHVGLVHRDPYGCKVKGFHLVSSIERNVSKRHCERLIPTTSPKAISNYTKFLGGWCNYLD